MGGQPFYGDPDNPVCDATVNEKLLHVPCGKFDILWIDGKEIRRTAPVPKKTLDAAVRERRYPGWYVIPTWGKLDLKEKPAWALACEGSCGVAVCTNAVVVAREKDINAVDIETGSLIWTRPLSSPPMPWGVAVDRDGRVIVSLRDGTVACFGPQG